MSLTAPPRNSLTQGPLFSRARRYSLVTDEELAELHNKTKKTWKKARLVKQMARQRGSTLEKLRAAKLNEENGKVDLLQSKSLNTAQKMDLMASNQL
jgi:hypothetical protein